MRIISGKFRGKKLLETNITTTRETQDKVRQAMFNLIGQFFDGGSCLDLFGGSGAIAIEAFSRGMNRIVINDVNKVAYNIIKMNIKDFLPNDNISVLNYDYKEALRNLKAEKFDYIFLDPPYIMSNVYEIINEIRVNDCLMNKTWIIFEMAKDTNHLNIPKYCSVLKEKIYGIKKVIVYEVNLL